MWTSLDREPAIDASGAILAYTKPLIVLVDEFSISGGDQFPGYFDFAMSSSGAAIVFYPLPNSSTTPWRAITRPGAGKAWNAPATAGSTFDAGGTPDGVTLPCGP